ncbi:DUF4394 domain-containing protein [Tolypothrix campylonemoides VB511288]|nr:DUF4394 domain-containing protein [Tolypothrix campylonemoides VB511288]
MKLNRFRTVISALAVVTIFNLVSDTKPAAAFGLVGLTDNNNLVLFDSNNPTATTSVSITGVDGRVLGIDTRPANNLTYGVTSDKIYTINPFTGAATFVSQLSTAFTGGFVSGVDFNPVPNLLRVVGGNGQNFRINVDTGVVNVDGTLNPGNPNITAAAYTNADNDPATGTTLYDIDYISDALFIQNPPNAGTLERVGSLGIDIDSRGGFDIFTQNGVNTAVAALTPVNSTGSNLYNINLSTGAATQIGTIGDGSSKIVGVTAQPVPEPTTVLGSLAAGGMLALLRRCRRRLKSLI